MGIESARSPARHRSAGRRSTVAAQRSSGLAQATVSSVLELQQTAGNKAVAVAIAGRHRVVQRHSSFEHALLGNTKPADVKEAHFGAKDDGEAWRHILDEELNRVLAFQGDATYNPTKDYPQIRWLQLATSKLWVSPGELSAMGDYLPDPDP